MPQEAEKVKIGSGAVARALLSFGLCAIPLFAAAESPGRIELIAN